MHAITSDRVRRLCKLLVKGESPKDIRETQTSGNAKPQPVISTVTEHISSFPVKTAHYSSKQYTYLNEALNVKIMLNLFVEKHPALNVTYGFYRKVFLGGFNLKSGRPQVDTCSTCEELTIKIKNDYLNANARCVSVAEKMIHIRRANKFYSKLNM
ncbi:hypothetical protein PR048_002552 [Dryococelus australis]|uniref:BEN domain-containing protein n=1 Tax=Dryococelus australis TaxID=614101 RepID=A0ABQ9IKL8_9NEOP|nr:hypothetical protein PR048_002552 [Dryococelus australis]